MTYAPRTNWLPLVFTALFFVGNASCGGTPSEREPTPRDTRSTATVRKPSFEKPVTSISFFGVDVSMVVPETMTMVPAGAHLVSDDGHMIVSVTQLSQQKVSAKIPVLEQMYPRVRRALRIDDGIGTLYRRASDTPGTEEGYLLLLTKESWTLEVTIVITGDITETTDRINETVESMVGSIRWTPSPIDASRLLGYRLPEQRVTGGEGTNSGFRFFHTDYQDNEAAFTIVPFPMTSDKAEIVFNLCGEMVNSLFASTDTDRLLTIRRPSLSYCQMTGILHKPQGKTDFFALVHTAEGALLQVLGNGDPESVAVWRDDFKNELTRLRPSRQSR